MEKICLNCRFSQKNTRYESSCEEARSRILSIGYKMVQGCRGGSSFSPKLEIGMKVIATRNSAGIKRGELYMILDIIPMKNDFKVHVKGVSGYFLAECFIAVPAYIENADFSAFPDWTVNTGWTFSEMRRRIFENKADRYSFVSNPVFIKDLSGSVSEDMLDSFVSSVSSCFPSSFSNGFSVGFKLNKPKPENTGPKKYEAWGSISLNTVMNDAIEDRRRSFIVKCENNAVVGIMKNFYAYIEDVPDNFVESDAVMYDPIKKAFVPAELSASPFSLYIIDKKDIDKWISFLEKEKKVFEAYSGKVKSEAMKTSKSALSEYKAAKAEIKAKRKQISENDCLTQDEKNIVLGRLTGPKKPDHFIVFGPSED